MNLDEAFKKELLEKINNPPSNLLVLRELLIDYKHNVHLRIPKIYRTYTWGCIHQD